MNAQDLMTRDPVVVDPTTPLPECRRLMRECGFRNLPVVDGHAVVGLITDSAAWGPQEPGDTASDVMVRPQVIAAPDDALTDVLTRCTWSLQEAVLVVDDGRLVGILTEHDVVKLAATRLPADAVVEDYATTSLVTVDATTAAAAALKKAREHFLRHLIVLDGQVLHGVVSTRDLVSDHVEEHQDRTVGDVVRGPVQWSVGWDTPLRDAATVMTQHHVGCLPVVDDDDASTVQGVISRTDLLRALMQTQAVLEWKKEASS